MGFYNEPMNGPFFMDILVGSVIPQCLSFPSYLMTGDNYITGDLTAENGRNIGVVDARETPCMKQKEQKSATKMRRIFHCRLRSLKDW